MKKKVFEFIGFSSEKDYQLHLRLSKELYDRIEKLNQPKTEKENSK
jgi:hypothetical protein